MDISIILGNGLGKRFLGKIFQRVWGKGMGKDWEQG